MTPRSAATRALVPLSAALACVLALAFAGTAAAHHEGDHHFHHGDPAGTIASFDSTSGVLTIDLAKGGTASGIVTDMTWIDCGHHEGHFWRHRDRFAQHFGEGDQGGGWDHHSSCSTDNLTPGTTVDDALLVLRDGEAVFWKVDLAEADESTTS